MTTDIDYGDLKKGNKKKSIDVVWVQGDIFTWFTSLLHLVITSHFGMNSNWQELSHSLKSKITQHCYMEI